MDPKHLREEYTARINRVIDYVQNNLDRSLTLSELANVANFSPFHFHRIFASMMGETLNQFIQRVRIERAASMLKCDRKKSITAVALDCGFSSSAAFARAFKEMYEMSATDYRTGRYPEKSKISKIKSKNREWFSKMLEEFVVSSEYINDRIVKQKWRIHMKSKSKFEAQVEVKDLDEMHVAYVRHIGPYKGDVDLFSRLFEKLFKWAGPRNLIQSPDTKVLCAYHDNPEITDEDKLRTDACITVPADTEVDGDIGKSTIPAGTYAVAHFEILSHEFPEAWMALCGGWLPESGYQPTEGPCFELYYNDHREHPEEKHILDICIPVKPL